jgi:glycosyltransferase involved in cell wall biosynthesis
MVVHSRYPADPRVRRETEALLDAGWAVDVVCLRAPGERPRERCAGAEVYRLPVRRNRGAGPAAYLREYLVFLSMAAVQVAQLHRERRYDVVQAHNMPDFLVFAGLAPRLAGARLALDVHDPVPELFVAKFGVAPTHPAVRLARLAERASTAVADHVFTVGEPTRRCLLRRGVPPEKLTVVVNAADPRLFHPVARAARRASHGFTLVYHGGLFARYGLDVAVEAVGRLRDDLPGLRLRIYGEGEAAGGLARQIEQLDLQERVTLGGFVPIDRIAGLVADADLGVVPYRRNVFTDLLYPTKAFEYVAMGIPVVMSQMAGMVELFQDVPDMFVEPDDPAALAERIRALAADPARLERLRLDAERAYAPYSWESQRRRYVEKMNELARGPVQGSRSPWERDRVRA